MIPTALTTPLLTPILIPTKRTMIPLTRTRIILGAPRHRFKPWARLSRMKLMRPRYTPKHRDATLTTTTRRKPTAFFRPPRSKPTLLR